MRGYVNNLLLSLAGGHKALAGCMCCQQSSELRHRLIVETLRPVCCSQWWHNRFQLVSRRRH